MYFLKTSRPAIGLFSLSLIFLFISTSAKSTANSGKIKSEKVSSTEDKPSGENVFMKIARSLAVEAISDFKESARRNPKLGFNFTLPMALPANFTDASGLAGLSDISSLPVTIGISAVSIKSAIIAALAGVKIFLVNILLTVLAILFLVSGTAFFVCNLGIISCSNTLGGLNTGAAGAPGAVGGSGSYGVAGSSLTSLFNSRAGLAEQYDRATHPVYKAFEEGYKKYQ